MSQTTLADSYVSSHFCTKPYKPFEFASEYEFENFKNDVETYKRCINDYIDEQSRAVEAHQQAAEDAIDEWNRYVNYELN